MLKHIFTYVSGFNDSVIQHCMTNKTLYLMGDSTTRQWYNIFIDQFGCKQFTREWTTKKWKSAAGCTITNTRFTVIQAPHCQPLQVGQWKNKSISLKCISKRLDKIPSSKESIVVVHLFAHMRSVHFNNYKIKMLSIRARIQRLLAGNRNVKIFIKMPHTFTFYNNALNDFFGYVYSKIIFEIFEGLYDKVIPLNQRDATNAIRSVNLHPEEFVVKNMVLQLFNYACKKQ